MGFGERFVATCPVLDVSRPGLHVFDRNQVWAVVRLASGYRTDDVWDPAHSAIRCAVSSSFQVTVT